MRWYSGEWRRRHTGGDAAVAGVTVVAALVPAAPASAAGTPAGVQVVSDPASLVNTFRGRLTATTCSRALRCRSG
jgi:hypothetical protein